MKPEIFAVKEGYAIVLAKAPVGDPKLEYRKEVEQLAQQRNGTLSRVLLQALDEKRRGLGLSPQEAEIIQSEVLRPYREFEGKRQRYEQALIEALQQTSLLSEETCEDLKYLQQTLGLRDKDVELAHQQISQLGASSQIAVEISEASEIMARILKLLGDAANHLEVDEELDNHPRSTLGQSLTQDAHDVQIHPSSTSAKFFNSRRLLAMGIVFLVFGLLDPFNLWYPKSNPAPKPSESVASDSRPIENSPTPRPAKSSSNSKPSESAKLDFSPTGEGAIDFVSPAEWFYRRALEKEEEGNRQEAIAIYAQALRLNPSYADAYYSRGNARKAAEDKQGAIQDYQRAAYLYKQQGKAKQYQDVLNQIKALQ